MKKKTLSLSRSAIHVKYVYCFCQITFEIYSISLSSNYPYNMERCENLTAVFAGVSTYVFHLKDFQ